MVGKNDLFLKSFRSRQTLSYSWFYPPHMLLISSRLESFLKVIVHPHSLTHNYLFNIKLEMHISCHFWFSTDVLAEGKQIVLYMSLISPVSKDRQSHGCLPITNLSSSGQIIDSHPVLSGQSAVLWVENDWHRTWWWRVFGIAKSEEMGHVMRFHNTFRERANCQSSGWGRKRVPSAKGKPHASDCKGLLAFHRPAAPH